MAIRDEQARSSNNENHNPTHQRSSGGKAFHRAQQRSSRRSLQEVNTGASNDPDLRIRELEAGMHSKYIWGAQEKDHIMAARNVTIPRWDAFSATGAWTASHKTRSAAANPIASASPIPKPTVGLVRGRITAARHGARRQQQHSPARFPPPRYTPASPIAGPSRVGGHSTSTPLSPMPTAQRSGHRRQLPASDDDDDLMGFNSDPEERDQHQKSAVSDDKEHHDAIDFDKAVGRFDKGKKRAVENDAEENPGTSKRRRNK
ncbi:hypothetical protein DFH08DRAFT_815509 [Mycena albidolilacea]|uniref:Uncharacterized protein n=1 Tax=Mycena albidolilacea TaxID=1033008 RepID=A0AAD6ZLW7_9AGAR|nr:hypothetical protein DFH08DRAFT_815509 [Mycena albidolilacea]